MKFIELIGQSGLSEQDEWELNAQHDSDLESLLPVLGTLFGLGVILFSVWDFLIDPSNALTTLPVRFGLVFFGSLAYFPTRLPWTSLQRYGYVYWTHASAIIYCESQLQNGFLFGLTGIAACIFTVSVITLRVKTFLLILSVPSILLVYLSAVTMSKTGFINTLMLYCFSVGLACTIMLVIRFFRQKAFLVEKKLLILSRHDSLTGAYNRGYITELADRELALAMRHDRGLAVMMLDIDFFKKINDNFGHSIGDEVIKAVAKTCTDNLREVDHFGRFGGEEFVCILPETNQDQAMNCADRLRRSIEAISLPSSNGKIQLTASIGVAVFDAAHPNWSALLKDADTALYSAKNTGRNRVILATKKSTLV